MAKRGRPKAAVKRQWEKLTILLTPTEMALIDQTAQRMTERNADGTGRTWTRSDVCRRWLALGREHEKLK